MPVSNILRPVLRNVLDRATDRPFFSGGATDTDTDVIYWAAAVGASGGSVSIGRLAIVNTFVLAEKASGAWTLTDDYLVLWAENSVQALTSLKRRVLATAVNSPTFVADRHYLFDGTANYINTGFTPGTHAVSMATTSVHIETYERVDPGTNSVSVGCGSSGSRALSIRPRVAGNASLSANAGAATYTLPVSTSLGLTQTGRNGPLVTDVYGAKNGVDMTRTADPAAAGASLPVDPIAIGCLYSSGVAQSFRAASVGFVAYGAALNGTQRLARYNNVQAWATSVGANV